MSPRGGDDSGGNKKWHEGPFALQKELMTASNRPTLPKNQKKAAYHYLLGGPPTDEDPSEEMSNEGSSEVNNEDALKPIQPSSLAAGSYRENSMSSNQALRMSAVDPATANVVKEKSSQPSAPTTFSYSDTLKTSSSVPASTNENQAMSKPAVPATEAAATSVATDEKESSLQPTPATDSVLDNMRHMFSSPTDTKEPSMQNIAAALSKLKQPTMPATESDLDNLAPSTTESAGTKKTEATKTASGQPEAMSEPAVPATEAAATSVTTEKRESSLPPTPVTDSVLDNMRNMFSSPTYTNEPSMQNVAAALSKLKQPTTPATESDVDNLAPSTTKTSDTKNEAAQTASSQPEALASSMATSKAGISNKQESDAVSNEGQKQASKKQSRKFPVGFKKSQKSPPPPKK